MSFETGQVPQVRPVNGTVCELNSRLPYVELEWLRRVRTLVEIRRLYDSALAIPNEKHSSHNKAQRGAAPTRRDFGSILLRNLAPRCLETAQNFCWRLCVGLRNLFGGLVGDES